MTKMQRARRDRRKLTRTAAAATMATLKGAAGEVIGRRMALGATALADPLTADHREFSRMVGEKMAALAAVTTVLQQRSDAAMAEMTRIAGSEASIALRMAGDLALCRSPAEIAAAQSRFALGWLARAGSQWLALSALAMTAGGAMLAPVHRAATGNAKRLRR